MIFGHVYLKTEPLAVSEVMTSLIPIKALSKEIFNDRNDIHP